MSKARDLANGATALSAVSATELGYLDGVTSAVQTQLDAKQAANAAVSTTELGYLDGVTSAIQTQLNQKPEYVAGKNAVINGGMDIWQRGTSISVSAGTTPYLSDRFQILTRANQAATVSRQATSDTTNLPNIQYCARVQRNSGQTGIQVIYFGQSLENVNSTPFIGKTVTLSFYARKGADLPSTLTSFVSTGTGTDQSFVKDTITGQVEYTQANTLTANWQRFTHTVTIGSSATQIGIYFSYTPTGTASTNEYFEITGVQLEAGSTATVFSRAGGTVQGELAACQRYYWRSVYGNGSANRLTVFGTCTTTTECRVNHLLPVQMRVAPTSVDYSSLRCYDGAGFPTITSLTLASSEPQVVEVVTVGTGYTTYRPTAIALNGNAGYIGFSAEL